MKKVVIASTNPVKINSTEIGFSKMFPDELFEFEGVSVPSDVSDQPMSEEETLKGATNRVTNAQKERPNADYWIGLEGGIYEVEGEFLNCAWMVIKDKHGKVGKGRTGSFFLPHKVTELVKQGMELGDADDEVFKQKNSKQANGAVGLLTGDVLTRTSYYEPGIILALIPFKNPELY